MTHTATAPATSEALAPVAPNALDAAGPQRVPVKLGVAPTTVEEAWRLAKIMAASELIPKNFKDKPGDVLVAIQMGVEIGLPPMQALQSIAVINGRPGVWGDGFLALLMASPLYRDHDEYFEVSGQRRDGLVADDWKLPTTAAVCTFWRHGKATPVTRRFTVGQAIKADLVKKPGPWQQYPDRMLAMRARAFAGRDAFPDVLRGISTTEELQDIPVTVAPAPAPAVHRLSEASAKELAASALEAAKNAGFDTSAERQDSAPALTRVVVGTVKTLDRTRKPAELIVNDGEVVHVEALPEALDALEVLVGTATRVSIAVVDGDDGRAYLQTLMKAE